MASGGFQSLQSPRSGRVLAPSAPARFYACMSGLAGSCAGASTRISALRVERNAPQAVAALIVSSPQRDARSGVSGHALQSAAAIPCHRNSVPSCPSAHLPICPSAHLPICPPALSDNFRSTHLLLMLARQVLLAGCVASTDPRKNNTSIGSGALRHVLLKTVKCSMWETNSLAMW